MQALLRAGQDATFRSSYAPLPCCRLSQFLAAFFPRNRRFRGCLKFGTSGGYASGERDGDCSESSRSTLAVNVYPKRNRSRPSGPACCFVFGYRLEPVVTGVPSWGPPPHPGPAVRSDGDAALHWAALFGNRRMVRLLIASDADVNAQNSNGCAVSTSASAECGGLVPAPPAVQVHAAALGRVQWPIGGDRRAAHARRRRGRPELLRVTLRCAAQPTEPYSRARAGTRRSNSPKRMESSRNGVGSERSTRRRRRRCTPPAASRPPPASRAIPARAPCADGCAVGVRRRRSPIQRAGGRPPTQHSHCNRRHRCAPRRALLHPRVEVQSTSRASCCSHRERNVRSRTQYCAAHSEGGQACVACKRK